jgi:sigma-E factor negative regulatory protein RseA
MSEKLKESLSAVMDGEADEFEIKRVLNETSSNTEFMSRWHRYHLIGHVLRTQYANRERSADSMPLTRSVDDTLARLWQAIDSDPYEITLDAAGRETAAQGAAAAGAVRTAAAATIDGPTRRRRTWRSPVTGVAVAASVALAVVLGFGGLDRSVPVDPGEFGLAAGAAPMPHVQAAMPVTERQEIVQVQPSATDQHRVQAYMLHHVHHTSLNNQGGVVPFVKVVAFEAR